MRKSKRVVAVVMCIASLGLAGCSLTGGVSKADLEAQLVDSTATVQNAEAQIDALEKTIKALTGVESSPIAITDVEDGSGKQTFNSIGGKILFSGELKYTDATQAPNTSKVYLSTKVSLVPSDNWTIQMNGTTTKYSHPTGIYGTVKIASIPQPIVADTLEEMVLNPFINSIPYTSKRTGKIFIEDIWRGMNAELTLLNNGKPAVIKCGVVGHSDISMAYTFYYDGDLDNTKTELINNLLKTIQYGDQKLRIE